MAITGGRANLTGQPQKPITIVEGPSHLPNASGGERQLMDDTAYIFDGFISDPATLVLGSGTILLSEHGGFGGYIHTGGATCLKGNGVPFFASDMLLSAPGGTLFDLTGSQSEEMLVESVSFADPAGLGNFASLGTIDGFRVPSFKSCNFEDFDNGLTLTGSPEKVYFSLSPFRSITAGSVSILTFDGSFSTAVVSIVACYIKDVQSDTKVIDYQGTKPSEVFQYVETTHDSSVTRSNVLTGNISETEPGVRVTDSFPLSNSRTTGILTLDSSTTTTISSTGAYVDISGATTLSSDERVKSPSNGVLEVTAWRSKKLAFRFDGSFTGANGDIYEVAFFVNGSLVTGTESEIEGQGPSSPQSIATSGVHELTTGDTLKVQVKNTSNANDVTFNAYRLTIETA